jgi:hypothetical protein
LFLATLVEYSHIKMESIRKCRFCQEIMRYEPTTTVRMVKKMSDDGVIMWIRKEIIEYGWRCNMTDDDCDVVFEKKIEILLSIIFVLRNAYRV